MLVVRLCQIIMVRDNHTDRWQRLRGDTCAFGTWELLQIDCDYFGRCMVARLSHLSVQCFGNVLEQWNFLHAYALLHLTRLSSLLPGITLFPFSNSLIARVKKHHSWRSY